MPVILTLLFLSLSGIIFMIGSKIIALQQGKVVTQEEFPIKVPNFTEVKHIARQKSKKYGFIALVILIRLYVKILHQSKKMLKKLQKIIIAKFNKILSGKEHEKSKEVSAFLRKISEYKKRVRKIKDKIKEEEGIE